MSAPATETLSKPTSKTIPGWAKEIKIDKIKVEHTPFEYSEKPLQRKPVHEWLEHRVVSAISHSYSRIYTPGIGEEEKTNLREHAGTLRGFAERHNIVVPSNIEEHSKRIQVYPIKNK